MASVDNVEDISPIVRYIATASQTEFDYPFPITAEADLVVYDEDTLQVLTTNYTVTGVGEDAGGSITFTSGRTAGHRITIYRDIAIERTSDFQQNGPFTSAAINDELDKITMVLQQLESRIGRAVRLSLRNPQSSTELELDSSFNGRYLYINDDGELEAAASIEATTLTQSILAELLNIRSAAEIAASVTPTNYTISTERINVLRYGTNTTPGTTNMTQAIKDAIAVAKQRAVTGRAVVWLPAGDYFVDEEILIDQAGVWLEGESMFTTRIIGDTSMTSAIVRIEDVSGPPTGVRNIGIMFDTGGNVSYDCLHLDNCNGTFVENAWLNGGRYGLHVGAGCDDNQYTNVVSELCYSSNFFCTGISGDIKYSNCLSHQGAGNGWYFLTSATSLTGTQHHRPILLSNCNDLSSNNVGFVFEDFNDVMLSNCVAASYDEGEPVEGFRFHGCNRINGDIKVSHTELYGVKIEASCTEIDLRVMIDAVGNYSSITAAASYGILVDDSTRVNLSGKVINSAGHGVRYAGSTGKLVGFDIINPCQKGDATNGRNGLMITGSSNVTLSAVTVASNDVASTIGFRIEDSPTIKVADSHFAGFPTLLSNAGGITITGWRNNTGIVTENSGTGSIPSGATSAFVTHGLSVTPSLKDISIVWGEQSTNDHGIWSVDSIDSTQFRVRVAVDPGASNLDFGWRAQIL